MIRTGSLWSAVQHMNKSVDSVVIEFRPGSAGYSCLGLCPRTAISCAISSKLHLSFSFSSEDGNNRTYLIELLWRLNGLICARLLESVWQRVSAQEMLASSNAGGIGAVEGGGGLSLKKRSRPHQRSQPGSQWSRLLLPKILLCHPSSVCCQWFVALSPVFLNPWPIAGTSWEKYSPVPYDAILPLLLSPPHRSSWFPDSFFPDRANVKLRGENLASGCYLISFFHYVPFHPDPHLRGFSILKRGDGQREEGGGER